MHVSAADRRTCAERLARQLPAGFTFQTLESFTLGDQTREVALFKSANGKFSLIPGGEITLGYDADRPWEPTLDELISWNESAKQYGISWTLREHIARATLRRRTVTFRPFLMETTAKELCWQPIPSNDPSVQSAVNQFEALKSMHHSKRKTTQLETGRFRIIFGDAGGITAMEARPLKHSDLCEELASSGFRFPTSDQWEYACGTGSSTLFRWGDHAPCDCYPTDDMSWDMHLRPNSFGVKIASNPYHFELVAEGNRTRGGDGGCTICGGAGFFLGWLTLATAYFEAHACQRNPSEPVEPSFTIGRRVLSL